MEKIYEAVKSNPIFSNVTYDEFARNIKCLSVRTSSYGKNDIIMAEGDAVTFVGIIISGSVRIVKEDERGNVSMITELPESAIFADVLACAEITHSPVTVFANENTEIMKIDSKKIISVCAMDCPFHKKLLENMLKMMAKKNFAFNRKIEVLSKRTTREKILSFFDLYRGGAKKFAIPYNREEMAQYLCVDRSAMSFELSKMQEEGLITFKKNRFEIL